jgi:hypothetical protein
MVRVIWEKVAVRRAEANACDGEYTEQYAEDNMRCEVRVPEWCHLVGDVWSPR